jgi:hypothetical protein
VDQPERETVWQTDWLSLPACQPGQTFAAILGDGVFGNVLSISGHQQLLTVIRQLLKPGGRFLTRHALIPASAIVTQDDWPKLLQQYRQGQLDDAEWGLTARLLGCLATAYNPNTYLLDNAQVFKVLQAARDQGTLAPAEAAVVWRYYFQGLNLLLPQTQWEALLTQAGFQFSCHRGQGKRWYDYYPVYCCW